jgi:hypothetical protein
MERQMFTGFLILVVLMSASDLLDGCTDRQARLRDEQILALLRERAACPQAAEVTAPAPMLNGYDLSDCLGYEGFIAACFTARGQRVGSTYPDAGAAVETVAAERDERPRKAPHYRMGRVIRLREHVWVEADQARDGLRWGENCVAQAGGTLTVVGGATRWRVRYDMPEGADGGGTLCPNGIEARVDPADLEGP